mmetsp:Transcript_28175/g.63746  ORF Transcript_28175/g.63746 Transcript_28175/m.63746 type:complete len:214 (+) Transcript_28175:236-877(+)
MMTKSASACILALMSGYSENLVFNLASMSIESEIEGGMVPSAITSEDCTCTVDCISCSAGLRNDMSLFWSCGSTAGFFGSFVIIILSSFSSTLFFSSSFGFGGGTELAELVELCESSSASCIPACFMDFDLSHTLLARQQTRMRSTPPMIPASSEMFKTVKKERLAAGWTGVVKTTAFVACAVVVVLVSSTVVDCAVLCVAGGSTACTTWIWY